MLQSISANNFVAKLKNVMNFTDTLPPPLVSHILPRLKSGYLLMESGKDKKWKKYVVALAGTCTTDLALYYYEEVENKVPLGYIRLQTAHVDTLEEIIMIITKEGTWFLCATNPREAEEWANKICDSLEALIVTENGLRSHTRRRLGSHITESTCYEIQSRDSSLRCYEFYNLFMVTSPQDLCLQAARGALSWSCMRSISWKLWLGCISIHNPVASWKNELSNQRKKYEVRKQATKISPKEIKNIIQGVQMKQNSNDEEDQNLSLYYSIYKDVLRTRVSMDFFRKEEIQSMMTRILYVWSLNHRNISYNQGMSEILAVIVYLLHVDQWPSSENQVMDCVPQKDDFSKECSSTTKSSAEYPFDIEKHLQILTDKEYIEHDAYLLLEKIMVKLNGIFCPSSVSCCETTVDIKTKQYKSCFESNEDVFESSQLKEQLDRINDHILLRCDPLLWRHLSNIGIQPEMYLLRWIRVLLSREFPIYQVWQLWDALFCLTPEDFSLIDYMCVAVIRHFREEILQEDDLTVVLTFLRNLNENLHVEKVVENARQLHETMTLAEAIEASSTL